ncbi:MAG: hypothetical protein ILP14_03830 [Oscillospiraceae bacterium]|nr:hypothetical protein [Oscillospiraceae bacterium]
MKRKSFLSMLLAVIMIFSVAAGGAQVALADLQKGEQADAAIHTIYATKDSFKQAGTSAAWRYAVTDLDHNGQLELIAAALHPVDRSNNLKVWELSADNSSFTECTTVVPEGESFPDIISNSADTYYDAESDTWYYLFLDHIMLSDANVYDVNCSVKLKDNSISYEQHAISHTEVVNGAMSTSYMDNNGLSISPDAYNDAAVNAFAGAERSSTNFDWFRFEDASELTVLKDSYAVFSGEKEPDKTTSPRPTVAPSVAVPIHTATPQATAAPVPSSTPQPAPKPTYLTITKNPTNENRKVGDTALFVANASTFDSLTWTLVAPNGGEYSVQNFRNVFSGSSVSGEYSTTLAIGSVRENMNGWGAYCTFYSNGQTARTSTAYIYVTSKAPVTPSTAVYSSTSGTAYHDTAYTVYILLANGSPVTVNGSICNVVNGSFEDGDTCTVYYVAYPNGTYDIYSVDIYGTGGLIAPVTPPPSFSYGSMGGNVYNVNSSTLTIVLSNGSTVYVSKYLCNLVSGSLEEGCDCTVYYTSYSDGSYDITSVDIYGILNAHKAEYPIYEPEYEIIKPEAELKFDFDKWDGKFALYDFDFDAAYNAFF